MVHALPETGDLIVFTKCPPGSYAFSGTEYLVNRSGSTFQLTNVRTGSGTYDQLWAVELSSFEIVMQIH